jgi:hypothetical protein
MSRFLFPIYSRQIDESIISIADFFFSQIDESISIADLAFGGSRRK